jgi:hypothetical protein
MPSVVLVGLHRLDERLGQGRVSKITAPAEARNWAVCCRASLARSYIGGVMIIGYDRNVLIEHVGAQRVLCGNRRIYHAIAARERVRQEWPASC